MGWSNQVVNLIVLTEQNTGFSGLFGYSPTVGSGNLIFSLAAAAGTDPYGNAYPQGLNLTMGSISGTTFSGSDYVINSSGEFFYSSTPAAGNLIQSIANGSGTDAYGNIYLDGITTYDSVDSIASQLFDGALTMYSGSLSGGWTQKGSVFISGTGVIELDASAGVITSNNTLDDGSGNGTFNGNVTVSGNTLVSGTACNLTGHASVTAPTPAPSRTTLGSTWNATTASQCNDNFVQIINTLGALGLFT